MSQNDDSLPTCGAIVSESRQAPGSSGQQRDPCSRFCLTITGHASLECGGRRFFLGPDTLFHVPAGQAYSQQIPPNTLMLSYLLRYRAGALSATISNQLQALGILPLDLRSTSINQSRVVRSIFQEMLFEQNAAQEGWEIIVQSRLMDLAVRTLRLSRRGGRPEMPVFEPGNDSTDRVARYALRLKSRFFRQESLAEAARSVGLSRRQFTDLFRKVTGLSWREYLEGLRLRHAAGLLTETDRSVAAVAFECGFNDLSHFHRVFKSAYGCSPMEYRSQRRLPLPARPRLARQPEPGASISPRFKFRGMKGWSWTLEQYLAEIPFLASFKLNFLMDCDGLLRARFEEWWKPMKDARKKAYLKLLDACREQEITFCFAQQPHFVASHLLDQIKGKNFEAFYQHYDWAQKQGVQWFSICLDGTNWGSAGPAAGGATHAAMVNAVFDRLRAEDADAQFIFCPVACWGDGSNPEHRAYLENLGRDLHPDVFIFWNGDGIVTHRITRVAAETYKRIVKHRLFLWDNYPVNDGSPTLHLGPVSGRDPDLCEVIDGYLSNAMSPQNELNRLALATCADYAFNPGPYKPTRSIGQAILRLTKTPAQQEALKSVIEAYPGFIVAGGGTGTNPVRERFGNAQAKSAEESEKFVRHIEDIATRFNKHFPNQFRDGHRTIQEDILWMRQQMRSAKLPSNGGPGA